MSIHDLEQKKKWHWDGVRNYEARNFMRDSMQVNDIVVFYHSNAKPSGPAGIARIASSPYADSTQFESSSKYFDPKATRKDPRWFMVDVEFVKKFPQTLSREAMNNCVALKRMKLWSRPRLSIMPITQKEFNSIVILAKKP